MKHERMTDLRQDAELVSNGSAESRHLSNGWWIIPFAGLGLASWYWMITGVLSLFH